MKKTIILTEKPSVARDFAKALKVNTGQTTFFESDEFVICWAYGHLLRPFNPEDYLLKLKKWRLVDLPILPPRLLYSPQKDGEKQLQLLKKIFKRKDIDKLIVATDAGREGELIARTIIAFCGVKIPSIRFWTSEALTPDVILQTLNKAKSLDQYDCLYVAGKARQFADWLVGMNLSRLATLKMGDLFSVGRVQTAVLGLLVDRRLQIDKFVSTAYWQYQLIGAINEQVVKFVWFDQEGDSDKNTQIHLADKLLQIDHCLKHVPLLVESFVEKSQRIEAPPLYSLTELQRDANKIYSFSAKKTLELAQKLYEVGKCLSYPRSDSQFLGVSSFPLAENILMMARREYPQFCHKVSPMKLSPNNLSIFDDSKLTDHHALIPLAKYRGNNPDELKIYNLVLTRFIEAFSDDAQCIDFKIVARCGDEYFRGKERIWNEFGWKSIRGHNETQGVDCRNFVPTKAIAIVSTKHQELKTSPPSEYTESTILKDMSNPARLVEDGKHKTIFRTHIGLGTQSTRAQIIETLVDRNYIVRQKRSLVATDKGVRLISQLREFTSLAQLTQASETAEWEFQLERIALGEQDGLEFINKIKEFVSKCVTTWR